MKSNSINKIAGMFMCVERQGNSVIVGCMGSLSADSLSESEIRYIAAWYTKGFPSAIKITGTELLPDYECKYPYKTNNFNGGFIKITTSQKTNF